MSRKTDTLSTAPSKGGGRLVSIQTLVAEYELSEFFWREKIASGELPAYRLSDKPGSAIRIKRSDVEALMRPVIPAEITAAR